MEDRLKQLEKEIDKLKNEVKYLRERRVSQVNILPYAIKRRHLEDKVIVFGDGDRPDDDTSGISAHFDIGTGVLSCWDGDVWLTTTLT